MKVYKKCSCCGKIMFLLLGSDFNNEVEFGSSFGAKDNIPHSDSNHEEDWEFLNNFLTNLQASHGTVFISLKDKEKAKLPKQMLKWTENYQAKAEEFPDWTKWKDISREFTEELVQEWKSYGFSFDRTHEWVNNVKLSVKDAEFASWLEKEIGYEPLKYLNETTEEQQQQLREQFAEWKENN